MRQFRRPSTAPLWRDEIAIETADERYVSRRQFTKFLVLTSFGMFVGQLWVVARSWFREAAAPLAAVPVARAGEIPVGGVKVFAYPGAHKDGKLTCWLATEKEVDAESIATDEEEDLALVRVHAGGLKPIRWAAGEVSIGQWAITPGIATTPQAVGIISALPHRVRPPRALIGVSFDYGDSKPKIQTILPGLGAEKAGLKSGDVILAVNATAVTNREQVVETLREFREGRNVKLRIQRLETQFTVEVRMMVPKAGQFEGDPFAPQRLGRLGGEVSQRAEGFEQAIEHDTVLQPWLCGGPLVDLDGKAIGINIARASRVSTYALPSRLVKQILDDFKSSSRFFAIDMDQLGLRGRQQF